MSKDNSKTFAKEPLTHARKVQSIVANDSFFKVFIFHLILLQTLFRDIKGLVLDRL